MLGSMPTPCTISPASVLDFDIGRRGRIGAAADRVFVIVEERELDGEGALQRVDESVDRAVAIAFDGQRRAVGACARSAISSRPSRLVGIICCD